MIKHVGTKMFVLYRAQSPFDGNPEIFGHNCPTGTPPGPTDCVWMVPGAWDEEKFDSMGRRLIRGLQTEARRIADERIAADPANAMLYLSRLASYGDGRATP